ncbi:MAG: sigma-70 family RNA polymerase sigma factor [Candidatus Latescibacteria bacterium]|nr:sigma-70 family RNA polymerase sigma factor [Candidatus Latescibacterota bacterium]
MKWGEEGFMKRLRAGDRDACVDLIDGHYRQVYWYLLGLSRDEKKAADLTQNTFAKVWREIGDFRGESSFRTWVFAIARNEFLMDLRASGRDPELIEYTDLEVISDPAPSAEEAFSDREAKDVVRRQVERLPGRYREVISLHYFARMSFREVGKLLSVPSGTVKSRVNNALKLLKEGLERMEVGHESSESGKDAAVHGSRRRSC